MSAQEEVELRECPFCGGEAALWIGDSYFVSCNEKAKRKRKLCVGAVSTPYFSMTKDEAIAAWNTRATPASEWVSVKDRMPERSSHYLATGRSEPWSCDVLWWDSHLQAFISRQQMHGNITHWQPLPAPPQPEEGV